MRRRLFAALTALLLLPGAAYASPVTAWGVPVESAGSDTTVGSFDLANHWIEYYLPLTQPYSGAYGLDNGLVDSVGTQSDSVSGGCGHAGTSNECGELDMYLKFYPVAPGIITDAALSFEFGDLDLMGINDPNNFFESVQFYSDSGTALSPMITDVAGQGSTNTTDGEITWDVYQNTPGDDNPLFIDFGGDGLASMIDNLDDPFWVHLHFSMQPFNLTGSNTSEFLRASLTTDAVTVTPEPTSLVLVVTGLASAGVVRLRRRRNKQASTR